MNFDDDMHVTGVAHFEDRVVASSFPRVGENLEDLSVNRRANNREFELRFSRFQMRLSRSQSDRTADASQCRFRGTKLRLCLGQFSLAALQEELLLVETLWLDGLRRE